ncbi:oxidoreductase [Pseudomonas aeruginosa]|uniref:SDR family NAD(P)-dependent oxidoreductase n=1 Tax=Pseudomonas aeruginosa TaxID=287 RepID=UPI0004D35FD1|nr:SDR family oxidoreductase [Pseudomonas aeruginosa]KEA42462.1 oxidoreductase [Pseudomonas aeruginosa]PBZ53625.1 oxidoreductase [Pseudomonas aeruginosa]PBZ59368.1 oxidoreductase [Pseudomonas aeruginosa]PBZ65631.1 oxidoreductase [Pseudomonas aeruginosa]
MDKNHGTVLVTGGSRGIGAEVVLLLAQQGYDVCFTYLQQAEAAEEIVRRVQRFGRRSWAIQADSGDPESAPLILSRIQEETGPLVGLVNNAGITGRLGSFVETDRETIRRVFEVNVLGVFALTQEVVKNWLAQAQQGVVVNVSSIAATLGAPGEYVHYAASKAAVEAFTIGLGKELAPKGIRVNCVSPGTSLTEIHVAAGDADRPTRVASKIPMGRAGEPKEIAEAIAWLVTSKSSYVTGTVLRVSGGL